jgi:hypothetical protein
MNGEGVAEMIANIVRAIHARRRKAEAKAAGGAGSAWEALILREAGPGRSDPIRPAKAVDLGRHV